MNFITGFFVDGQSRNPSSKRLVANAVAGVIARSAK